MYKIDTQYIYIYIGGCRLFRIKIRPRRGVRWRPEAPTRPTDPSPARRTATLEHHAPDLFVVVFLFRYASPKFRCYDDW